MECLKNIIKILLFIVKMPIAFKKINTGKFKKNIYRDHLIKRVCLENIIKVACFIVETFQFANSNKSLLVFLEYF